MTQEIWVPAEKCNLNSIECIFIGKNFINGLTIDKGILLGL